MARRSEKKENSDLYLTLSYTAELEFTNLTRKSKIDLHGRKSLSETKVLLLNQILKTDKNQC